jgi:hypothetical protein
MGTPCAPIFANIFLYQHEKPLIYRSIYYKRYLDDLFIICLSAALAHGLIEDFNSKLPTIKLDAVSIGQSGVFLDLELSIKDGLLSHKLFQKAANKYSYIPPMSAHSPSMFRNIVLQELKRYRLACTDPLDFDNLIKLFATRLSKRGYTDEYIPAALAILPTRTVLLQNLFKASHKDHTRAVICIDLPPLRPNPNWRELFRIPDNLANLNVFHICYHDSDVIIAKRNPPNIAKYLLTSVYPPNKK